MTKWISVLDELPPIGTWALVIQDRNLGDWYDRQKKPLRQVYSARLNNIDSEGWSTWELWNSNGYSINPLYLVSHWQPYPSIEGAAFEVMEHELESI
jgi:hypothetical protein